MTIRTRLIPAAVAAVAVSAAVTSCSAVTGGDETKKEQRNFRYTGQQLSIDAKNSDVRLRTGEDGTIAVSRELKGKAGQDGNATWSLDGSRLTLDTNCSGISLTCSASYTVSVPKGAAVRLTSTAGSVSARDMPQPLELSARDGSVTVDKASGKLSLTVHGGNATATGISSPEFTASSVNGRVKAEFSAAPRKVSATANNGNVNVTLPKGSEKYRVTTKATNGQENSSVPSDKGSERTIELRSQNGAVRLERAQ